MPEQQNQPDDAELQTPAEPPDTGQGPTDLEQSGEGVQSPEAAIDAYVESLGMQYDDELDLTRVSDDMLPQVAARLAQVNPDAARRMYLRHSDYTKKRQREAEELRAAQAEKERLEQLAAMAMPQAAVPSQPVAQPAATPTYYEESYAEAPVLEQRIQQLEQYLRNLQVEMNARTIEQQLDAVSREFPDMTAPGAREELLRFMAEKQISDPRAAYWAMKGPELVNKVKAEATPAPKPPQVPPSGSGPAKTEPPKTPEAARAGLINFFKKRGVTKLEDL